MPLIEQNMSLGQLRLEKLRLQALWWQYADKVQVVGAHPRIWTSGKRTRIQRLNQHRVFLQLMAIGEHLDIINNELDNRVYDHASKIRVVNFRPEA